MSELYETLLLRAKQAVGDEDLKDSVCEAADRALHANNGESITDAQYTTIIRAMLCLQSE